MKSRILDTRPKTLSLMAEILDCRNADSVTLQSVIGEHSCAVGERMKYYEGEVRIYLDYFPTLTSSSGGGKFPSILKKSGKIFGMTPQVAESIMGFPKNWTRVGEQL